MESGMELPNNCSATTSKKEVGRNVGKMKRDLARRPPTCGSKERKEKGKEGKPRCGIL